MLKRTAEGQNGSQTQQGTPPSKRPRPAAQMPPASPLLLDMRAIFPILPSAPWGLGAPANMAPSLLLPVPANPLLKGLSAQGRQLSSAYAKIAGLLTCEQLLPWSPPEKLVAGCTDLALWAAALGGQYNPVPAPQKATSPFGEGVKYKGNGHKGLSILKTPGGEYVVSNSLLKGAFGKFRGAVSLATGELFGIKELRSIRAPAAKPNRRHNTWVTRDEATQKELQLIGATSKHLEVHEVAESNGKIYIFQTWMAGDTWQLARKNLSQSERQALARAIVHHVACDLQRCNEAGFIHHDIKLANILWREDGAIATSDFGLARRADKQHGTPGCTPGMCAPEIVAKQPYGSNSDVWSLGVTYLHFLMQSDHSPLNWEGNTQEAFAMAQAVNEAYFTWREAMLTPQGHIDVAGIKASNTRLSRYFAEALRRDPAMTRTILQHVSAPAQQRDTPEALKARLLHEGLFSDAIQTEAATAAQRVAASDDKKRNIQGALLAARESRLRTRA